MATFAVPHVYASNIRMSKGCSVCVCVCVCVFGLGEKRGEE